MPGSRALALAVVYAVGLALPSFATAGRAKFMKSWSTPRMDNPHGEPVSETVKRRRRRLQDSFSCGPTSTSSSSSTTTRPTKAPVTPDVTPAPTRPITEPPVTATTPAPVDPPTAPPVAPPTRAPVDPPTAPPVAPPTRAPVDPPTAPPVAPPTRAPVDPPTAPPVAPPTRAPVDPPTAPPVAPHPPAPVDPPTAPPVAPRTPAPVEPPTPAPVNPPTPAPQTDAPETTPGTSNCEGANLCENGGSCEADPAGGYTCSCASGYAGMHCQTSTSGLPQWKIELNYNGNFSPSRQAVFEQAAARWSRVIPFVPGGGSPDLTAGVLTIDCNLKTIDGPGGVLGSAGPTGVWNDFRGISYSGSMEFDDADVASMEADGSFVGVIMHEMGHVIGIGTLWDSIGCSTCRNTNNANWQCPAAAEVFAQMEDMDSLSAAPIIETEGGTGTACGHFNENMFDNELMTGFVTNADMPLSKLTCASLEDMGYVVKAAEADAYTIPSKRPPNAVAGPPEEKKKLNDEMTWDTIKIANADGSFSEEELQVRVRF